MDELNFPLHDHVLDLLEEALNTSVSDVDEDGNPTLTGLSLHQLLDFFSGYDKEKSEIVYEDDELTIAVYPEPLLSEVDIIRALIQEVRRLRTLYEGTASGT